MSKKSGATGEQLPSAIPGRSYSDRADPDTGLHREIEADAGVRGAMAEIAGVREISSARASFDVTPQSRGRVHVAGTVRGRVGQTCVVTLDPIETEIDETVDLMFAPAEQIPQMAALVEPAIASEAEITDAPEPIVDGVIDLGRLATDVLFLAIDPYPRKAGVVFEPPVVTADPEDHPFAALKALQIDPKKPGRKTPKGKQ